MGIIYLKYYKRLIDVIVALPRMVMSVPLFLVISFMLWIENKGRIPFYQERSRVKEEYLHMLKFKTMRDAAYESERRQLPGIQRITKAGKWTYKLSLDELEQLWNAFKGYMSMTGPCPLLCKYAPLYSERQRWRQEVMPAQVKGQNAMRGGKKIELDLYYPEHLSFKPDVKNIWLSAIKVLNREGINQSKIQPMKSFWGTIK